jgi:hypothetical protein
LKITEKRLRNIIRSTLNEFDNSPGQNSDKGSDFGVDQLKDSLSMLQQNDEENAGSRDKKSRPAIFRRHFTKNPIAAFSYFKNIIEKDHSEFMMFFHVFLDLMLSLNDSATNDRENFKSNQEHFINEFTKGLKLQQNNGQYISQNLVKMLGEFFIALGPRLKQFNFGDSEFHEEQNEEYNEFRESRIRRRRK